MNDVDIYITHIQSLDSDAHIRYSSFTKQWYLSTKLHFHDGSFLSSGISKHAPTPDAAVIRAFNVMVTPPKGHYVCDAQDGKRVFYQWNGVLFVPVHPVWG